MNVTCPHCHTAYRVDPRRVPAGGATARCAACQGAFPVEPETAPGSEATPPPAFGATDPDSRARRLSRALVSDIVVYHADRRERSLAAGTLRKDFGQEVRKSWSEYVGQVGEDLALSTPYFRDALNDILAGGARVF